MSTIPACPICGDTRRMARPKVLYGHMVCKKCVHGFANRRQLAFFIDAVIIRISAGAITSFALPLVMGFTDWFMIFPLAITFAEYLAMVSRDMFNGYSPGKALTGVQAVDINDGLPISYGTSIKRNLPLLIPLVPILVAFQLIKGKRWGDGWARSKVIWVKYKDNPVFLANAVPVTDVGFGPARIELPPVEETDNPYKAPRV